MHTSPQPGVNSQTHKHSKKISVEHISEFTEIIDVRTPAEYAIDHIPGAINAPVLSNEQRIIIGTMYAQESAFKATRLGAAMVARNIAGYLETIFADKPRNWHPLIYCWRGGKRSGSMCSWLNLIGWRAHQLDGGYKAWRKDVLNQLEQLPSKINFIVLAGPTGSGKTRLLNSLERAGAQVLDLEGLAHHRGSLLGSMPGQPQPAQRGFESGLLAKIKTFNLDKPVFVEAESRRIGVIHLPDILLKTMYQGQCIRVNVQMSDRIEFLLQDYDHLFADKQGFKNALLRLKALHGSKTINKWHDMIDHNAKRELFSDLVVSHYDPSYKRSSHSHFTGLADALVFDYQPNAIDDVQARKLLKLINYPI